MRGVLPEMYDSGRRPGLLSAFMGGTAQWVPLRIKVSRVITAEG